MQVAPTLVVIGIVAALLGGAAMAGDHPHRTNQHMNRAERIKATNAPWQTIANPAQAGMPGFGWQYFFDPVAPRAVVISPDGHYYFSGGAGLRRVAATQQPARVDPVGD